MAHWKGVSWTNDYQNECEDCENWRINPQNEYDKEALMGNDVLNDDYTFSYPADREDTKFKDLCCWAINNHPHSKECFNSWKEFENSNGEKIKAPIAMFCKGCPTKIRGIDSFDGARDGLGNEITEMKNYLANNPTVSIHSDVQEWLKARKYKDNENNWIE